MLAETTVHTSGVNWESVVTIVGAIVVIMTTVLGMLAKYITNRITGSINQFRIDVISKMEERLSALEGWRAIQDAQRDRRGR